MKEKVFWRREHGKKIVELPKWEEPKDLAEAISAINTAGGSQEYAYLRGKTLNWVRDQVGCANFREWLKNNHQMSESRAMRIIGRASASDGIGRLLQEQRHSFWRRDPTEQSGKL